MTDCTAPVLGSITTSFGVADAAATDDEVVDAPLTSGTSSPAAPTAMTTAVRTTSALRRLRLRIAPNADQGEHLFVIIKVLKRTKRQVVTTGREFSYVRFSKPGHSVRRRLTPSRSTIAF